MISTGRRTLGVRAMPDKLDSGYCNCCQDYAVVRINIDGIWTTLCDQHVAELVAALLNPEPAPKEVN